MKFPRLWRSVDSEITTHKSITGKIIEARSGRGEVRIYSFHRKLVANLSVIMVCKNIFSL